MARTPSMTREQCEAALGPRGSLTVNRVNKPDVKKWLSARGIPSTASVYMPYRQLQDCYNDISDRAFERALQAAKRAQEEAGDDPTPTTTEIAGDMAVTVFDESEPAGLQRAREAFGRKLVAPQNGDAGSVLANMVAPYLAQNIFSTVLAKVDAKLADVRITRIELEKSPGETITLEGHHHAQFPVLLKAMRSRMANGFHPNIMICGPTGSGKSHGVAAASSLLRGNDTSFRSNGAVTMDHQVVGWFDAHGKYHKTAFREAFCDPCDYLFDEMDSSDNSPLLALAQALANGHCQFPDGKYERHPDSRIIAAGNTWGLGATADFVGRNKIDGAIRSRFPIRLHWDYDEELERAISGNEAWARRVQKARARARAAGLKVIIDPRMSQAGAALIAQGCTEEEAAKLTYLADLEPDQRTIVDAA